MKMNNRCLIRAINITICIISICLSNVYSQDSSFKETNLYWGDVGGGFFSKNSFGGTIGLNLQKDKKLYSLRFTWIDSLTGIMGTPHYEKHYYSIEALTGFSPKNTKWHMSVEGGIAFVIQKRTQNIFSKYSSSFFPEKIDENSWTTSAIGLVAQAQLARKISKTFGIGIGFFAKINTIEVMYGVTANFEIGKLYESRKE
jgi:hypothetical protein